MDTIETQGSPVGAEGATSSQDTESQVDAQPSQTETGGSDATTEQEGAQLLAGKYKSQAELEKAYKELESKLGESSRKASLVNKLEQTTNMSAQEIEAYLEKQAQVQQEKYFQENPMAAVAQEVEQLKSKLAYQETEKELNQFLSENPEYSKFKDKILNLGLTVHKDMPFEEIARDYFGEAIAHGQQSAYQKIEQKTKTQATSVSAGESKKALTIEDMRNMSASELSAILPHMQE